MLNTRILGGFAIIAAAASLAAAGTGRIVVANDEWTLSNTGFSNAGGTNAATFTTNVASWLNGNPNGDYLIWSNNFGLTQGSFTTALGNVGTGSVTQSTAAHTGAQLLASYDAVFVGGNLGLVQANVQQALIDFVNGGGDVYLAGGTGNFGGAAGEAAAWNTFLGAFDMGFASTYNNVGGNINVSSNPHPIFGGVNQLYQDNGNSIINVVGPHAKLLVSQGGNGLYAVYDYIIPLPSGAGLAMAGMGILAVPRTRRRA